VCVAVARAPRSRVSGIAHREGRACPARGDAADRGDAAWEFAQIAVSLGQRMPPDVGGYAPAKFNWTAMERTASDAASDLTTWQVTLRGNPAHLTVR